MPGKEVANTHAKRSEGLGYCGGQLGRTLGIWVPFIVLPLARDILLGEATWGLLSLRLYNSSEPLFFFSFEEYTVVEGWRQVIYNHC